MKNTQNTIKKEGSYWTMYLEQASFKEKTEWTSLEEDSVANNFANASKVDVSEGTSKHSEL